MVSAAPTLAPSTWNCTLAIPMLDVAVALTVIVPETVAPETGEVIDTTGLATTLFTLTVTAALVVELPAVSFATAVSV